MVSAAAREEFAARGFHLFQGFLNGEELADLLGQVRRRTEFREVAVKAGMNLAYHVVDGLQLRRDLPDHFALVEGRIQELAQELAGRPLGLMADPKRSVRVQCYRRREEGFFWHLDGGAYGALLTLTNTNQGATDFLGRRQSRWLKPFPYLLFPFQRLFELAKPVRVVAAPGDLLILHGGAVIHRGVTQLEQGERIVLAASYDPAGRRKSALWEALARRLNY
jgi:hypothetical protein